MTLYKMVKCFFVGSIIVTTSFGGAVRFEVCSDTLVSGLPKVIEIPSIRKSPEITKDNFSTMVTANRAKFSLFEIMLSNEDQDPSRFSEIVDADGLRITKGEGNCLSIEAGGLTYRINQFQV